MTLQVEEKRKIPEQYIHSDKYCPLGAGYNCKAEQCMFWITDSGKEECAIVKLAKGWCL